MPTLTRTTDPKGRVSLPKAFANSKVVIEQISESELRIRKAEVVAEEEVHFREEFPTVLSNEERDLFLELLDNPPRPNKALRQALAHHKKRRHA